jgi:hypothetical protein
MPAGATRRAWSVGASAIRHVPATMPTVSKQVHAIGGGKPVSDFAGYAPGKNDSARQSEVVSLASDYTATMVPTGIVVGTAGTVKGRLLDDGSDRDFKLAQGVWPLCFKSIKSTANGTTALDLVLITG